MTFQPPPLFSIVTIAHNDIAGLRSVADSVLGQVFPDWEWIVIDGASKDGSADFLATIVDPRLTFVSEPDRGIYNAMNKGIDRAVGDYLIFMNSGDTFASTGELGKASIDVESCPDILYGDAIEVDAGTDHYKPARSHRFGWYSMFTHHQAIYYRRRLFGKSRYDESFRLAADWALTLEVLRRAGSVKRVRRPICRFLRGGASFTKDRSLADAEAARIYRDHTRLPRAIAHMVFLAKTGVNRMHTRFPKAYDMLRMRW